MLKKITSVVFVMTLMAISATSTLADEKVTPTLSLPDAKSFWFIRKAARTLKAA